MARAPRKIVEMPDEGLKQLDDLRRQATDLGVARKGLDDAVSMTRGLWISFISLSAYLMVAVGSVTHVDLFLENPLELPLVGVKVPLVVFFWLAPILYIIIHSYLLLNLKLMSDNVRDWLARLEETLAKEDNAQERHRIAQAHKLSLPNFFPVQMLAGPRINQVGMMRWGLASAVMLTIIVAPILLLFLIQAQFLPYHHETVTWVHRLSILADLVLLWYFWPRIRGVHKFRERWLLKIAGTSATASLLVLSIFIATFPGEPIHQNQVAALIDQILPQGRSICKARQIIVQNVDDDEECLISLSEALFDGAIDEVRGVPRSLFANRIVLPDRDFVGLDEEAVAQTKVTLLFRGRRLESAVLIRADLRKADFSGASMRGAVLDEAQLQGAFFECAYTGDEVGQLKIRGWGSGCTDLQGASLEDANLDNASLPGATLNGTSFAGASLRGANLTASKLKGANLEDAQMQGATLVSASLQGSSLSGANLDAANIGHAKLIATELGGATFKAADLGSTDIRGSVLGEADFQGALMTSAFVWRVQNLERAYITAETSSDVIHLAHSYSREDYELMANESTEGLLSEERRIAVLQRMSVLDPSLTIAKLAANSEIWEKLHTSHDSRAQAQFLANFACLPDNAPFVASAMFGFLSPETGSFAELTETAKIEAASIVLTSLENETCPGANGIKEKAMTQLRIWAPNWKPTPKLEKVAIKQSN